MCLRDHICYNVIVTYVTITINKSGKIYKFKRGSYPKGWQWGWCWGWRWWWWQWGWWWWWRWWWWQWGWWWWWWWWPCWTIGCRSAVNPADVPRVGRWMSPLTYLLVHPIGIYKSNLLCTAFCISNVVFCISFFLLCISFFLFCRPTCAGLPTYSTLSWDPSFELYI